MASTPSAGPPGGGRRPSRTGINRRDQIIAATIEVLAEHGSANASFTRIAEQAGLSSPGLISYHFKTKEELWRQTVATISSERMSNIAAATEPARTATDALRLTLQADLAYMGSKPKLFAAIVEAFYTLRAPTGQIEQLGVEQQALLTHVVEILKQGQRTGEFGEFDAENLGLIIHGALTQFLGQQLHRTDFNLQRFTDTLVSFALQAARQGTP
jgi:TetR/AcrR family fatty acid metabolism transcriptional regulator